VDLIALDAPVVIPDSPLARDYEAMPDVEFRWMSGDGVYRPWLCPIYGYSAELEVLDLLYSLVKLVRPKLIVETGCHLGIGTYALGKAAKEVGAQVVSCDVELKYIDAARERCQGLPVSIVLCKAECLGEVHEADFLFLDGSEESRIQCVPRMKHGALAVMHDTNQERFLRDAFTGYGDAVHMESWRGATLFHRKFLT
jgi:predicted O-methyltransferase YrrM